MHPFNVITTVLGGMILILALGSRRLAESPIPPTVIALATGVLLGPELLGVIDLAALGDEAMIREHLARLTLAIALLGVALRIPPGYVRHGWRPAAVMIAIGMPLMWVVSSLLVLALLGLPFWLALLIGATIAATDPVAASAVVTGELAKRNLPERMRHLISLESGANDGLGYLFVLLPFLMLTHPPGEAVTHWLTQTLLWEVCGATVIGALLGAAAGWLLQYAERHDAMQPQWRLVYTVALAICTVGTGRLIASDEVLLVFAAGVTFSQVAVRTERAEEEWGEEAVNRFFAVPIFAVVGLTIPWEGWADLGWRGVVLAMLVLVLRRLPGVLLIRPLVADIRRVPEALFVGWFGPIAVAALYYASLMEQRLNQPVVWHVVSLTICASVIAHGMSGATLTRRLGRVTRERAR